MDMLVRLAWALPLVLTLGLAVMFALKRIVAPASPASRRAQRMTACESLALSDDTRVHLVEIDGKPHVLVESTRQVLLQILQSGATPPSSRFTSSWVRRLQEARSR